MELKKLKLRKLDVSILSERELNNVFGGLAPAATVSCRTGFNVTYSATADKDSIFSDSDTERVEDIGKDI